MADELQYLVYAVILYLVMIVVQAAASALSGKASIKELLGPRDEMPSTGLSTFHGRAKRAQANMTEGMVMFIPLVLICVHTGQTSVATAAGAALFFFSRLAFAPLYWFGVPILRTVAWAGSIVGLILLLLELLT